jgi:sugar transferase (PEP-CTERM system associated)
MVRSLSMRYRLALLIFGDLVLVLVGLQTAFVLRYGPQFEIQEHILANPQVPLVLIAVQLFSAYLAECYSVEKNRRKRLLTINIIIAATLSFFILSALFYIFPTAMIGRGALALAIASFVVYQWLWHFLFFFSHNLPRFSQRVLIVGVGKVAGQVAELIRSSANGFQLIGFIQCNGEEQAPGILSQEVLGGPDELRDVALSQHIDMVVIALTERRGIFPLRDALSCKLNGIELLDAPAFYEIASGKLMLEQITPSWFIYSTGFTRPGIVSFVKRLIDIVLACIGLIIALPLMIATAIAIKLDSPGPLFFSQIRVGNREQPFRLYKFRTMCQNAEADTGAVWATNGDSRVTRVGRFLRKTRIDELPQLFNVLVGHMSLIGPRPERPEFVEMLKEKVPYYSRRHFIKPGVTGWAQVRYPYGASVEDALEKLRYDLYYVKNLSPFLDTLIFFETIKVVLFGKGGR